jgi:lipopolysaccharide export system permease protein
LHERLVAPLYPLAFVFLIIAFVGQAQSTRSSRLEGLVAAFILGALCRLIGLALTNGVAQNAALIVPLYGFPLGVILFSLILIKHSERQKSGGLAEKSADAFTGLAEATVRFVSRFRKRRAVP